jgi:gamma-glutamylcysteine synthetase
MENIVSNSYVSFENSPTYERSRTLGQEVQVFIERLLVSLISNFRRVLYVVCFVLGNSPAS